MNPGHLRIPFHNLDTPVEALIGQFLHYGGESYIITDAYMETIDTARLDLMVIPGVQEMLTYERIMDFAIPKRDSSNPVGSPN